MRVALKDWRRHTSAWLLDVVTGEVAETAADRCRGFVDFLGPQARRFLAVYAASGELWCQVGGQRWDVGLLSFTHDRDEDSRCEFRSPTGGEIVVALRYPGPLADPVNRADPAGVAGTPLSTSTCRGQAHSPSARRPHLVDAFPTRAIVISREQSAQRCSAFLRSVARPLPGPGRARRDLAVACVRPRTGS